MYLRCSLFFVGLFSLVITTVFSQKTAYPTLWQKIGYFDGLDINSLQLVQNSIYLGTSKGLYCITEDSVIHKLKKDTIGILSLALKNNNHLFAITYENTILSIPLPDDKIDTLNFENWFFDNDKHLFKDVFCYNNALWLIVKNKGLFEGDNSTFLPKSNNAYLVQKYPQISKWITAACQIKHQKWIGAQNGLIVLDAANQIIHKNSIDKNIEFLLPYKEDTVYCIYTNLGDYYLGKFSCQKNKLVEHSFSKIQLNNNYKIQSISDITINRFGFLWLLSKDIIAYFDPFLSRWNTLPKFGTYTGECITMCFDSEDNLWLGTYKEGLFKVSYPQKEDSIIQNTNSFSSISYEKKIELDIEFEEDSCQIFEQEGKKLGQLIELISLLGEQDTILITGHTSSLKINGSWQTRGSKWAMDLSKCRAEAIKTYLLNNSPIKNPNRILCIGVGDTIPKFKGGSESLEKKNRRVEISFKQKKQE